MTIRREIMRLLYQGEWTAGEISRAVRIPQKEVYPHLEHIMQSLRGDFSIVPAACLSCGFIFSKRKAVQSPSRCPLCKSEHIKDPAYPAVAMQAHFSTAAVNQPDHLRTAMDRLAISSHPHRNHFSGKDHISCIRYTNCY